jgi:hypothetical protein
MERELPFSCFFFYFIVGSFIATELPVAGQSGCPKGTIALPAVHPNCYVIGRTKNRGGKYLEYDWSGRLLIVSMVTHSMPDAAK